MLNKNKSVKLKWGQILNHNIKNLSFIQTIMNTRD